MSKPIREVSYASYVIPVRVKDGQKQIAIIEYEPGAYGNIGGRFEDCDIDARGCLRRELVEELNPAAAIIADIAFQIPEQYKFCVAPERIAKRCAKREVFNFFLARVPDDFEITFCEQCPGNVHVVWLDAECLLDEKVIGFPDEREYFAEHIMPLVRAMM